MTDPEFQAAFGAAARADGQLIERCIAAYYKELAATWTGGGRVMFDGGACLGYHSKQMARLETVSRVIAVEANSDSESKLAGMIAQRVELHEKITLHHAALQADPVAEFVTFHVSPSHPGRSGLNPVMRGFHGTEYSEPVSVPATTIDRLCAGFENQVGFIKLDLEGGEFAALRGGVGTLRAGRPVCVFENGASTPAMNGYSVQELLGFFEGVGLRAATAFGEVATAENLTSFWYAWAFPTEQFDEHVRRLRSVITRELTAVAAASATGTESHGAGVAPLAPLIDNAKISEIPMDQSPDQPPSLPVTTPPPPPSPSPVTSDDKIWIILCHLSLLLGVGFILPLIVYFVKRQDAPATAAQAREALNFHISVYLYGFVSFLLCFVLIGFVLLPVIAIASVILAIIATLKASEGQLYHYPLTLRLV